MLREKLAAGGDEVFAVDERLQESVERKVHLVVIKICCEKCISKYHRALRGLRLSLRGSNDGEGVWADLHVGVKCGQTKLGELGFCKVAEYSKLAGDA